MSKAKNTLLSEIASLDDPNLTFGEFVAQFAEDPHLDTLTMGEISKAFGLRARKHANDQLLQQVVEFVASNQGSGLDEISTGLQLPKDLVSQTLRLAVQTHSLCQYGRKRGATYYTPDSVVSDDQIQESILDLVQNGQAMTRPQIVESLSAVYPKSSIRANLQALVEAGEISRTGVAKGTRYAPVLDDETADAEMPAPAIPSVF